MSAEVMGALAALEGKVLTRIAGDDDLEGHTGSKMKTSRLLGSKERIKG